MIRKLMAIFYFLAINISWVYANDIGVDNYQYECRIGPIGVHDTFDMNQLNMLFGHITQPVQQHKFGINNSIRLMDLYFDSARVCVLNDYLATISVTSNYAKDGEALGTPRGIVVGHDLDTMFRLYGTPFNTWKDNGLIMYSYGTYSYGITFGVNPSTNIVESIGVFIPTC